MEELELLVQQMIDSGQSEEFINQFKAGFESSKTTEATQPEVEEDPQLAQMIESFKAAGQNDQFIEEFKKSYKGESDPDEYFLPTIATQAQKFQAENRERRDADGETYVLPEGWEWLEDSGVGDFFVLIFGELVMNQVLLLEH